MAGVTDLPFRELCRRFGAGLATGEMVTSKTELWNSRKSSLRLPQRAEGEPRAVQIVGNEPQAMAAAARRCVELGAQIIDINLGCPAKKVCNAAAGSALMRDQGLVADILEAVVSAAPVPVTLKMRTGWDLANRNAPTIARIAEDCGIQALAVHGRSRACRFVGPVEFDTVAAVVAAVSIPVLANGDIRDPEQASRILQRTGASGVMIGRGALGRPWLFRQVTHYLQHGHLLPDPAPSERLAVFREHLQALHRFYGEAQGARIARKHFAWYGDGILCADTIKRFNRLPTAADQLREVDALLRALGLRAEAA